MYVVTNYMCIVVIAELTGICIAIKIHGNCCIHVHVSHLIGPRGHLNMHGICACHATLVAHNKEMSRRR